MSLPVLLFILRLVGAAILLAFLAVIAWLIYQDLRLVARAAAAQEKPHSILRRLDGEAGAVFPLAPVTSIGRAPGNTIVLEDDYVSNEHALLMLRGQQWWVEDLNSRNGTLLNGERLHAPTIISAGDVLTIGGSQLKLEALPVGEGG
ncbi:MAG: FHA domain-containing protein [Chloroflexi bacterium]|nr:FHA domain-containing protein [Chloroflexota bacterium]